MPEFSKRLIMQTLTTLNTMLYCPKCQQTYEDGTQRFCVNDGVRLHPQKNPQTSNQPAGVFSGIINKNGVVEEKTKQPQPTQKPAGIPVVKSTRNETLNRKFPNPPRREFFQN